ncbi:hypothetical protein KEC55_07840 [Burkholderia cepacia]|uniref:hypothetical protein n=1 Tax=Burkholderia cepacia TaxID=292 RepID=UPI00249DF3E5|nr:hypothetical protein [Burkholderia cepacia]WGY69867.1 hypothetical protein KEC55_07840 [Burkholderia cepacia]
MRANHEIALLSNLIGLAIEFGQAKMNPCRKVRRNEEQPRTETADPAEYAALAGNRKIEFLDLSWPQVDRKAGHIRVKRAKQRGKKHGEVIEQIEITPPLAVLLDRLEAIRGDRECLYVFPKYAREWLARAASANETGAEGAAECFIVIGHGESDTPTAKIVARRADVLDAVLGMMYDGPCTDDAMRVEYASMLDDWDGDHWNVTFEIGGIDVWRIALARSPAMAAEAVAWVRKHPDTGELSGDWLWNDAIEQCRKDSGVWFPLGFLGASPAQPVEAVDWRELTRRLYVELFYCDQQMTGGRRPKWTQGAEVRDALRDAKAALEAAPQPARADAREGLTDEQRKAIEWAARTTPRIEYRNALRALLQGANHAE